MMQWLAAVALLVATAHAQPRITYHLDLAKRQTHDVTIELVVPNAPSPLPLAMPVWTPGAYELRNWGKNVTLLGARSSDGKALDFRRTGPSTFVVNGHGQGTEVHVRYQVYAATLSDDGSFVDDRHAYLNGTSILLYSPPLIGQPTSLSIDTPSGWQIATALPSANNQYEAASYETLVDGPIEVAEVGRLAEATLDVHQRKVDVVVDGMTTVPPRLLTDLAAILDAEVGLMGPPPWTRYLLLIHLEDGLERVGALEHASSSSVLVPRRALIGEPWKGDDVESYEDLLYVIAHELFHAWNARLLRPAELIAWDPLQPRPARSLWITEGLTEFFAHRAMLLSRRWSLRRWRAQVCEEAVRAQLAARRGLSLEEDAELAWSSPSLAATDPDGYYARGHLAALALDVALSRSGGLVAVMRRLVAEATQKGRPLAIDTERLATALGDATAAALLRRLAAGHDEVGEARAALLPHGLILRVADRPPVPFIGLGLELTRAAAGEPASLRVLRVIPGSAAQLAGLRPADRILLVDGAAVTRSTLNTLESIPMNHRLTLQIRRENRALTLTLTPEALILPRCTLDEEPTKQPYLLQR